MTVDRGGSLWCDHCESANEAVEITVNERPLRLQSPMCGYEIKAVAGIDPQYSLWRVERVGPVTFFADTESVAFAAGDDFQASPPATFG